MFIHQIIFSLRPAGILFTILKCLIVSLWFLCGSFECRDTAHVCIDQGVGAKAARAHADWHAEYAPAHPIEQTPADMHMAIPAAAAHPA